MADSAPNTTCEPAEMARAAKSLPEKINLDTIHEEVWQLFHLIDTISEIIRDLPRGLPREGRRYSDLDRVDSLAWMAREFARKIGTTIDDNYHAIQKGR